jgi:hypothetical protein
MLLPSLVHRWMNGKAFASQHARQTTTRPGRRRARLRLEALEDRSVPSTVMNLNDSGFGSLRQAIIDTPSGATVDFQPGLSGPITLTTGELLIAKNLTIAGPGASIITVSGNHASRVFDIAATFTVDIAGLMIADGMSSSGGGIFNGGTLTVANCTISGNTGDFGGGGILNYGPPTGVGGTMTIINSTISGNTASSAGGGIDNGGQTTVLAITNSTISNNTGGGVYNAGGTLTITDSTINDNVAAFSGGGIGAGAGVPAGTTGSVAINRSTISGNTAVRGGGVAVATGTVMITDSAVVGNTAAEDGGGIVNQSGGPATNMMTIINSTISDNTAARGGGIANAINAVRTTLLTITNSTISGNTGSSAGGGIINAPLGTVNIRNTITAGNTASSSPDVSGVLVSQGHNLIGDGSGGSGYTSTDLVGTAAHPIDPKLGPLRDNGGPTQTRALLPGSPAIDAGDNAFAPGPYDQRGPGFARIVNGVIDIGAFEAQAAALTVQCSVATPVLPPPNHQLVYVGLSVQVSDPSAAVTVQVFANDDALSSDAADLAPGTLRLRSERQGGGSGRVYLIVVTATDAAGDVAVGVCTVVVPHDQSADALAAVEQQAADAEAYFLAFHTAPPGYALLG